MLTSSAIGNEKLGVTWSQQMLSTTLKSINPTEK